ncbi:MAG: hypothetical protein J7M26_02065, partial [Armatimonadetes bacterium]|nr:hypothetical protein [Armatimonadota bacterium]
MSCTLAMGLASVLLTAATAPGQTLELFSCSDQAVARQHWQPQSGSQPVEVQQLPEGSTCVVFKASFDRPRQRACWDWKGKLDLSGASRFVFEVSATGGGAGGTLGVYFGSGPGWYARFTSAALRETWTPLVFRLDSFRPEDKPAGWDKVDRFRFSVWSAGAGAVTYRVRKARLLAADPGENFVKNGSFEI